MEEQIGHTLDIDWLGDQVLILIGKDVDDIIEAEPTIEIIFDNAVGVSGIVINAIRDGKTHWFVVINERKRDVILHESIHLAQFLMDKRNIPTGVENTEVLAYLVGYIYENICMFAKVKP